MIRNLNWLHRGWARLSVTGLVLTLLGVSLAGQSHPTSASDTYSLSAELVALDETARRVTLKARIVSDEAGDLSEFGDGDDVTLLWSGLNFASGIRRVVAGRALESERFAMPAEFVASEMDGRYVLFTVTLPADGIEPIKTLEPGEWVTATAPVGPQDRPTRFASIRPFVTTAG